MSWISLSICLLFLRLLFIFSTITSPVPLWYTCTENDTKSNGQLTPNQQLPDLIDPLQLRHVSVAFQYTVRSRHLGVLKYIGFTYSIDQTSPVSLVSVIIAYISITFRSIQHILEALLVHDCVCRDHHRSCISKMQNSRHVGVPVCILKMMTSAATGL